MFVEMLIGCMLAFAVIVAVVCRPEWKKKYYLGAKILNSAAFVAVFLISTYISGAIHSFWLMLPGVLFCFAGDVFMALYNRQRKRGHFLMGVFLFLSGHLCFVRWLCSMQTISIFDLVIPVLAVLLAWYLVSRKDIHTGRMKPFIILYAFFVALFFSKGQHLAWSEPTEAYIMIAVGSALFFVSDISIIFLYFQKRKGVAVHIFNLTTYYGAMFLLTSHVMFL